MNTKEILSIVALAALGLCLLCSLAKAAMKGDKGKKHCDKACGAFVFLAIILLAVSQLLGEEKEKYDSTDGCLKPSPSSPYGCEMCKCAVPLDWQSSGCGKFCTYKDSCPDEDDPNKNKNSNKFCWLPVRKNKCTVTQFGNCLSSEGADEKKTYPDSITGSVSGTYDTDPKAECGCICDSDYKGDHCQTFIGCPYCNIGVDCDRPTVWPFSRCNVSCGAKCGEKCCKF